MHMNEKSPMIVLFTSIYFTCSGITLKDRLETTEVSVQHVSGVKPSRCLKLWDLSFLVSHTIGTTFISDSTILDSFLSFPLTRSC